MRRRRAIGWAAATLLAACTVPGRRDDGDFVPPPIAREFRGAWVASVAHIDWPSRRGLSTAEQRAEMLLLLDRAREIGLNAIVLQVRPSADALYPSPLEPWSEFLTGASGRAPDPPWDPLAEWVAASHARGLELHAWFNPFRARHASAQSEPAASHVARSDPAIVKPYGDQLWMDPGEARAAQRMVDVVDDVVRRYDIDGVHIDDYFYPYPHYPVAGAAPGSELPFPDEPSYQAYRDGGGTVERNAWRRGNVDRLIQRLVLAIHNTKPWVRFGISPFGLPHPDLRPPTVSGFSQYHQLHADVERWLHEGWLDYLAPQLYWPIGSPAQPFPLLLDLWRRENRRGRHLWPGLFTSRIGAAERAYAALEVLQQVAVQRSRPDADGHIHFSMVALLQNRDGIADRLREGPYAAPALPPATPWLGDGTLPAPPQASLQRLPDGGVELRLAASLDHTLHHALRQAALRCRRGAAWRLQLVPLTDAVTLTLDDLDDDIVINGVDRLGALSAPVRLQRRSGRWSIA